jgi:Tfp pilus assembly protein PilP
MKEKKIFVLAAILLLLVGVYAYFSQKIDKATKPTGAAVDVAQVDRDFGLKSKVTRAIRTYMKEQGDAPRSFDQLQGKYLDAPTYKRALERKIQYTYLGKNQYRITMPSKAAIQLASKGPGTNKQAGASTSSSDSSSSTATEVSTTDTGWKYDPTGKPDPFKPFILASAVSEEIPVKVRPQLTPLQKMPLSEIQAGLKAIIWGQLGNKALVEDATGKGYVVQEGTYVGQHDGIVKKIYQDRIVVEEYRRDPAKGRLEPTEVVLKLKKVETEE